MSQSFLLCYCVCLLWILIPAVFGQGQSNYLGCYIDGGPGNRLFQGLQQNFPGKLTPKMCNDFCFNKGFAYAGTQYSVECFCSRNKPSDSKKSTDDQCNAKCAGDNSKVCGGNNRLSVQSTGIPETQDNFDSEFAYVGCFKDFSNGSRLMTGYRQDFPDTLTTQLCCKLCRRRGFRFAGLEYGVQCFCDNQKISYRNYADDEGCSTRCAGNNLQLCGGNWRLSLFDTGVTDSPRQEESGEYIGCYKDQENPRSLKGLMKHFGKLLTPLKCTGWCYSEGYLYAGTQNSNECYCGDEHPNPNQKVSDDECSKACTGDTTQKCGSDYRNSIRETGIPDVPAHEKYIGCFNDENNVVLKGLKITFEKTNTPRRCLNYCWYQGFKYSGVEYGKECLCGNQEPSSTRAVSGNDCNKECSGDPLESCGAGWRIAVYSTDLSTNVIPLIIPQKTTTQTPPVNKMPCQVSDTTVNGERVCKGDVIFEDQFNTPLGNKWKNVIMIPEVPDYEFVVLDANPKNCFISRNQLVIKPTIADDSQVLTGNLQLQGCTGTPGSRECGYKAFSYNILPPIHSARINTKESFTFRYGIVEIKAKFPIGDWIVPELWLEPKRRHYGANYKSGRIRIAMSRGNKRLVCDNEDLSNINLESGILMGSDNNVKSRSVSNTVPDNWHDNFHVYTLIWKPGSISFKIDNEPEQYIVSSGESLCSNAGFTREECAVYNSASHIAPFDVDFYLSIGLTAGNARDFPDHCINRGRPKPWKHSEVKKLLKFWQDKQNWQSTWSEEKSALYVEYVRVTAL